MYLIEEINDYTSIPIIKYNFGNSKSIYTFVININDCSKQVNVNILKIFLIKNLDNSFYLILYESNYDVYILKYDIIKIDQIKYYVGQLNKNINSKYLETKATFNDNLLNVIIYIEPIKSHFYNGISKIIKSNKTELFTIEIDINNIK